MAGNVYGIDLGTCNFKIYCKSNGKILKEKNTIATINRGEIYAYGDDAYAMYEKAPEAITVNFPVNNGVIADFNLLQEMIYDYFTYKLKAKIKNCEIVVAVPTDITDVEKRAFYEVFYKAKMRPKSVLLCEKPVADAVGLGLDINEPKGFMVVDLGADTIEISVISLGGLVLCDLLHTGGNKLDEAIISYIRKEFNLIIGQKSANLLKEAIGSAMPGREDKMTIVGRDVVSGLPIEAEIKGDVIYEAMKPILESLCESIKLTLEKTPPELSRDIIHDGIYITGGSSQIHALGALIEKQTTMKVNTNSTPDENAARGVVRIVSESKYKRLPFSFKR